MRLMLSYIYLNYRHDEHQSALGYQVQLYSSLIDQKKAYCQDSVDHPHYVNDESNLTVLINRQPKLD